jgi:hypothetical protein
MTGTLRRFMRLRVIEQPFSRPYGVHMAISLAPSHHLKFGLGSRSRPFANCIRDSIHGTFSDALLDDLQKSGDSEDSI